MKQKLLKFSLCLLLVAVGIFIINYFFFHFVTDDGISLTWQPEAGKPFVADLIGNLGVLFIFGSAVSFIASIIFFADDKNNKGE